MYNEVKDRRTGTYGHNWKLQRILFSLEKNIYKKTALFYNNIEIIIFNI